jgi:hypothetical protein
MDHKDITFIRTVKEIEAIRQIWERLQLQEPYPAINADIDRYLSVLQAAENECTPLILLLKQNDQPRAMVIGRLERHSISLRLGYKTILRPKLRCMTVAYGGIIGQPDEGISAMLVRRLMGLLRDREVDLIFFNHLRTDSVFFRQVRRIPGLLCRNHFPVIEPHWRISIPKTMDQFFASRSKSTRHNLRNRLNRLERKYPGQARIHSYSKPEDVAQAIKDAAYISKKTYQYGLGVGFVDTQQTHILLNAAAAKGWLRCHVLYVNEEPVAFDYNLKYGRAYFGELTGYDPKWKDFNVGTVTMLKVLEILCQEGTTDYFDFGFGDAEYKKSYTNECWQEVAETYIFALRFYPLLINLLNSINSALASALTWTMQKIKLFAWIKRLWRRSLQNGSKELVESG